MKPQIIDRFVYVKGKKISEVENTGTLHGKELIPIADNNQNFHTTVDQISEYVDNSHDYLTTEDYNDLKGQIDSERTNRQEADNELNQSIQDTKSELHSTISNVESELLNEVNDLQGQIDNINDTGIANGVTLDTVQTITGKKTFTTVPKSTADATEDTDLVNKKYVDSIANASFVFTSEELNSGLSSNRLNECINAYNNNNIFCIQRDNGEKIPAKIRINAVSDIIIVGYDDIDPEETGEGDELNIYSKFVTFYKSTGEIRNEQNVSFLFSKRHGSNVYLNGRGKYSRPTKETVGLENVDNTADIDKPISNATKQYITEQGFARTSDIPEGLEIGETTGTAFDGSRGKAVEQYVHKVPVHIVGRNSDNFSTFLCNNSTNTDENIRIKYKQLNRISGASEDNFIIIPSAKSEKAGVMSAADKQKLDSIPTLTTSGDGTKYLSDNGTYKTIEQPDLSNYVDNDTFNESITQLGSTITNEVTTLEKKDAELQSSIETVNESITQLDDKYLPLSGGTLNGSLTVTGGLTIQNGLINLVKGHINYLKILFDGLNVYLYNNEHTRYRIKLGPDEQPMIRDHVEKKEYKIYHERDSKVTTNDVSGGLNITKITQSAYDGLDSKSANTLYIITE